MGKYDDIIDLPHHVSKTHPHMAIIDRAAQFSPFAALTGHDAAIKETARRTDGRIELDEYEKEILSERIQTILNNIKEEPQMEITYFQPDEKKEGGSYVTVTERVKKIDLYKRVLVLKEGGLISIDHIVKISGNMFL